MSKQHTHSRDFVYCDSYSGVTIFGGYSGGWLPADCPTFTAGPGHLAAHDALEHFNSKTDFRYEMRAFGAMLAGRGLDRDRYVIPSDLGGFMATEFREGRSIAPCPARWDKPLPEQVEDVLEQVTRRAIEIHKGADVTTFEYKIWADAMVHVKRWMRRGYRVQKRRFNNATNDQLIDIFSGIRNTINSIRDPQRGDKITIMIDLNNAQQEVIDHSADIREERAGRKLRFFDDVFSDWSMKPSKSMKEHYREVVEEAAERVPVVADEWTKDFDSYPMVVVPAFREIEFGTRFTRDLSEKTMFTFTVTKTRARPRDSPFDVVFS